MQQTLSFRWARKHSTSDTRVLGPVCQACAAQGVGWGRGTALDRPRGASAGWAAGPACSPGAESDRLGLPDPETGEPAPQADLLGLPALETGEPAPQADLLGFPALETGAGVPAPPEYPAADSPPGLATRALLSGKSPMLVDSATPAGFSVSDLGFSI